MPTNQNNMFTITGTALKNICPSLSIDRANNLASIMNKVFPVYGINTKDIAEEFVAQLAHESIEFSAKTENLNYSAQALANTWPTRFAVDSHANVKVPNAKAIQIQRQPQLIANEAYNGRMGNRLGSNDGWNFRGAGFLQNTGKDSIIPYFNFKKAGKGFKMAENINTPEDVVELLRTNDVWALDAACWEFAISKSLIDEAINDDVLKITKAINGGIIGLPSRQAYTEKARKYL